MLDLTSQLNESVSNWISQSRFEGVKVDAFRHLEHIGAERFVEQLVSDYLAEQAHPFHQEIVWDNFTFQLAMKIWFSESPQEFDLYVVPCDDRFEFNSPALATNGWLVSRSEDLSQIGQRCRAGTNGLERIRIVKSTVNDVVSYCFIPILHQENDGTYSTTVTDVRTGLRDLLKTIVFRRAAADTFQSVFVIPFGLEVLSEEMDDLVWVMWNEFRAAGRTRPYDIKTRVEGLSIRLAFGLPNVVNSLLKVMMDEGEVLSNTRIPHVHGEQDDPDTYVPPRISATWKKKYQADFMAARSKGTEWETMLQRVVRTSEDMCTNIEHHGGLVSVTLRDKLGSLITSALERVLVGRRVIVAHMEIYKCQKDYKTLVRELGFVSKGEAEVAGKYDAANLDSFKAYLSEVGLSRAVLDDPYRSQGLWPEELDWLTNYAGPAD